jgi:cytochrome c biogenesis protein CcmG, thiol:disulfide interchange protein DsbE
MRTVRILLWLPLVAFLIVLGLVFAGLVNPHDNAIRSRMIGKPLPTFTLPAVRAGEAPLKSADFADGRPRILNLFASWCIPCAAETTQLLALKQAGIRIDGIAISDRPADTIDFLARSGDPYERIGHDDASVVQLSLGSSGVPESFVVDGKGIIRLQKIGDIRSEDIPAMLAAVRDAQ